MRDAIKQRFAEAHQKRQVAEKSVEQGREYVEAYVEFTHFVVTEDSRLVGILSERDLGGRGGANIRRGRTVGDLMTPRMVTAAPDTTLRKVANLMRGRLIGSRPERRSLRMSESRRQAGRRPVVRKAAHAQGKTARGRSRKPDGKK